jgi:hypothetical protein
MQVLTTARPPSFPQVSAAHFEARGAVPKEDWARVVVLTNLFSIEELGSCGDVRMIGFDLHWSAYDCLWSSDDVLMTC